jgi:hypothetical protein
MYGHAQFQNFSGGEPTDPRFLRIWRKTFGRLEGEGVEQVEVWKWKEKGKVDRKDVGMKGRTEGKKREEG